MDNRPERKLLRLRGYDYRDDGMYFVTICTDQREMLFGTVIDGTMKLTIFGQMAQERWDELPRHFPFVALDAFIVMPNHVHGIIVINRYVVGARHASPLQPVISGAPAKSVGAIVGSYKSAVTSQVNRQRSTKGASLWQRGFYDRIIRSEQELDAIRQYILYNPSQWEADENNPIRFRA